MKPFIVVLILAAATTVLATPLFEGPNVKQDSTSDVLSNVQDRIKAIIKDLQDAGKEAALAVAQINAAIGDKISATTEKIQINLQKMRDRVEHVIQSLINKFATSEGLVAKCIAIQRVEAERIFNDTIDNTMLCAKQRASEVGSVISHLKELGEHATAMANNALDDMQACTKNDGVISTGSCLGKLALTTELKAVSSITEVGLALTRVNFAMGTLPAALEVCAANRLIEAGVSTGKVLMDVGGCSASSVFSVFTSTVKE